MKNRKSKILRAIVESFIETATPISSKFLQKRFNFPFSSATIRNEMGNLEQDGFLFSPHTSAGRVPTDEGFRFFLAECRDDLKKIKPNVEKEFLKIFLDHLNKKKINEKVFDAISVLTQLTPNVAFSTIPSSKRMFFLGFSNIMKQPEFIENPGMASGVFKILEENFQTVLESLEIDQNAKIFIGNENIIPEIQSCTLIVCKFKLEKIPIFLGILGPMRMDFGRNIVAVEIARDFIQSDGATFED